MKGGWLRRKPQTGGLFRSRQPFPKGCAGGYFAGGSRFRGRHFGAGNPSDRAWRRGHLPLTREANGGAGPATNRETMIRALSRTRVGADSISARSAMPQTSPGGYGIRPYNGFFNVAANRETTILALPRTCVGDDACIVPHPTAAQTHRVGGRCRKACRAGARPARKPCGGANACGLVWPPCQRGLAAAKAADWGIV